MRSRRIRKGGIRKGGGRKGGGRKRTRTVGGTEKEKRLEELMLGAGRTS